MKKQIIRKKGVIKPKAIILIIICLYTVCFGFLPADFNRDTIVNNEDLATFSSQWLEEDINESGHAPVLVIAASNSANKAKASADYLCDGTDDDVQIQAALYEVESTRGTVFLAAGTYSIGTSMTYPDYVTLEGEGMLQTVIVGDSGLNGAIFTRSEFAPTAVGYRTSAGSPAVGMVIKNLKLDGSAMFITNVGQTNATGGKGTQFIFYQDSTFERVWIFNTPSSGFGNDYGKNIRYINCKATECGRVGKTDGGATVKIGNDSNEYVCRTSHISTAQDEPGVGVDWKFYWMASGQTGTPNWELGQGYASTEPVGCSGFGLGMGSTIGTDESHFVTNCVSNYNFNDGFTFEGVGHATGENEGWGATFLNCTARGNKYGFEIHDAGAELGNIWRSRIMGCSAFENTSHGIDMGNSTRDAVITGNILYNNLGSGLYAPQQRVHNLVIADNIMRGNQEYGILSRASNCSITGNLVEGNKESGIYIPSTASTQLDNVVIAGNVVVNNSNGTSIHSGIKLAGLYGVKITNVTITGNVSTNIYHQSDIDTIIGSGIVVTVNTHFDHKFNWGDVITIAGTNNFEGATAAIRIIGPRSFTFLDAQVGVESPGGATATIASNTGHRAGILLHTISGDIENVAIVSNVLTGAKNKNIEIIGVNYSNIEIANNAGYVTENGGAQASISDGGTIAHGLSETPTYGIVSPSVTGEIVSIIDIDETNLTVAIKKDDGTEGTPQTIYWQAVFVP